MIKRSTSIIQGIYKVTGVFLTFAITLFYLTTGTVQAQVTYTEGFEIGVAPFPANVLPYGWTQGKYGGGTDPDNEWDIMNNSATNPPATPFAGTRMARYNSNQTTAGEASFLSSKKLDLTAMPGAGTTGSVRFYRDNGAAAKIDRIQIYINGTPDMTGTPSLLVSRTRYCGAAPAGTCNAWEQVSFTIPQAGNNNSSRYISIVGISDLGFNIYIDNFTIDTWPIPQSYAGSAVVNQNTATTAPSQTNVQIIGLRVSINGGGTPMTLQDITFNTNGTNNALNDIVNAKLWFTGGTGTFNPTYATLVGTVATPHFTNYTFVPAPATFGSLENGDNYFWITYDVVAGATFGNYVDAECVGFIRSGSGLQQVPNPATLPGSRLIDVVYCIPAYSVGTSWLGGSYTNNDYIKSVVLAGDVAPGINNQFNTNGPGLPFCNPCQFAAHPPDYEFFPPASGKTAVLTQGNNYPIALQVGTWYSSNYIAAWIDYNRDGDHIDAGEKIAQSPSLASNGVFNTTFTVPLTSTPGNTRLRVREVYATSNIDPCNFRTYGETEDYVVTIVPTCAPAWPGWKTWLGFTNDWDNPANWCGGVPTPTDNARIPGQGAGPNDRPGDYAPKIKTGVIATTKNLRIEANDTVFIDAPSGSSLTVDSSLFILTPSSALIVNSTFNDTAQVLNGALGLPIVPSTNPPFKGNIDKVKNVWIFTQAELLSEGMLAGDVVSNMLFHIKRNATNNEPFRNLTVRMWYTTGGIPGFRFNVPGVMPPVIGPAPVTIFGPQNVSTSTFVPVAGTWGTIDLTLIPGSFVWSGAATKLVIEMCYDNQGFGVPNNNDLPGFTQTLGYQHYISMYATKDNFNYAACDMIPTSSVNAAFITGAGVGGNTFNMTSPWNEQAAVGQWLFGNGLSVVNVANGAYNAGSPVITYAGGVPACIQVGHWVRGGGFNNGAQVIAITATTVTVSTNSTLTGTGVGGAQWLHYYPAITGIAGNTITISTNICSAVTGSVNFGGQNSAPSTGSDYRPNITFKFDRPYNKYPINVRRDWVNNGLFTPAISMVTMFPSIWGGISAISGNTLTTFYDLRISNNAHVRMDQDAIVTDTLTLQNGRLKLNNRLVTLTNPDIGALYRINGFFQSDADVLGSDVSPFGRFQWQMGNVAGLRTIPFINMAGTFLSLDYNVDLGSHDVTFATYATPGNNQNIPGPIVTNILGQVAPGVYGFTGDGMVDRYYMIDNSTPVGAQADISFRYSNPERASYGNTNMRAQRWVTSLGLWEQPLLPGQVHVVGNPDVVTLADYNQFSANVWWTIVGQTTPLPVELLDFTATQFKDKVRLDWTTATEINNSHFVVERSLDNNDFSFIDQVESKGPSTGNIEYRTWDLNPVEGIQYYYLRQYDRDGRFESFGPVSAKFSKDLFDIITATVSSSVQGLTVVFNYDSNEPFSYRIVDMTGRLIVAKDRNPGEPGVNVIDIDATLSRGAYQIILQNSDKVVTRKFFY